MSRRLRYVPEGGALVEVTCRTVHSRFLLRPSQALNEIVLGVLARAQRMYPLRCCAFAFISNHCHLLLDVDNARQLSDFMCYFNSNLAKELGLLTGWRDKIWARRYQSIVISNEEEAQIARLAYVLAHGVKEGLVEKVAQWPGVHCVRALVEGETVEGYWFNRSQEHAARQRRQDFDRLSYATPEVLTLSPLPCWKHLSEETRRRLVAELVTDIETEAAIRREQTGSQVLGVSAVRGQHPLDRPKRSKKSPAPLFHAASKAVRRELYAFYAEFVAAYRQASEKFRAGERTVRFPLGSFPPALPFVAG